jgi:iron transport multicopper oxidase
MPHLARLVCVVLSAWLTFVGCQAKTVTYDFNVTWVTANPDGHTQRKIVGINGQWPLPVIEVNKGDQLVVNMFNGLGDKTTSIHFHGMFQNGTNDMDGPSMITQCPIPPGSSFTYNFTVNQNGTYWYHCHTDYCYPDGYRQALIVHDTTAPFANDYAEEFIVTMSDWYHELAEDIAPSYLSLYNPTGGEPVPDAFLFNDTLNTNIPVKPNTTYLFRLINIGAFVAQYFYIEGHTFKIVEIDGVYTEPTEADTLYIAVAQRYSILVTTKNTTNQNFPIVTVADSVLLDFIPPHLQLNNTNWLEYDPSAPHPQADIQVSQAQDLVPFDDITLVPSDGTPLLPEPDLEINITVIMRNLMNGYNYAFFNNITYTPPKVPTLYTVLSSGDLATNAEIYGEFTHPMVLNHNDVVQIVVNNADTGTHPIHLHGHNFQVIDRQPPYGPNFYSYMNGDPVPYDPSNHTAFPAVPARRDVFVLPPHGYYVMRFVADNPGVWALHCHIDWHLQAGLSMLMIEAPTQIQERVTIPADHFQACKAGNVPSVGNAAGNTQNLLDLAGQNVQQPFLPAGFTGRGIVALTFSTFTAFLGMAAIVVYGMTDLKFHMKNAVAERSLSQVPSSEDQNVTEIEEISVQPKIDVISVQPKTDDYKD